MLRSIGTFLLAGVLMANQAYAAQTLQFSVRLPITRAQFVERMVTAFSSPETIAGCFKKLSPSRYRLLFTDVSINDPFAPHLCVAMRAGIIQGYGDGSFRPHRPLNFAEAAKIITRSLFVSPVAGLPDGVPWFATYVRALEYRSAIPVSISAFDHSMTLDNLGEILNRLEMHVPDRPSIGYDDLWKRTEEKYRRS